MRRAVNSSLQIGGGSLSEISFADSGDAARALGEDEQIAIKEEFSPSGTPSNRGTSPDARRETGGVVTVESIVECASFELLKEKKTKKNVSPR